MSARTPWPVPAGVPMVPTSAVLSFQALTDLVWERRVFSLVPRVSPVPVSVRVPCDPLSRTAGGRGAPCLLGPASPTRALSQCEAPTFLPAASLQP